jgi:hypothetical protein
LKRLLNGVLAIGCIIAGTVYAASGSSKGEKYTKKIDNVISSYLVQKFHNSNDSSEKGFEVHHVYGTETKDDVTTAYILSEYGEFQKSSYDMLSGQVVPAVIKMKQTGSSYEVIDYKEAKDGEMYVDSIKEMFPEQYAEQILKEKSNSFDLNAQLMKEVHEWNRSN